MKNAKNVSFTKQLRAQHAAAESGGAAFNLLISPRTQTVSGPLLTAIERTGGKIFMFDPTTGKFFDVVTDGNKVRPPQ